MVACICMQMLMYCALTLSKLMHFAHVPGEAAGGACAARRLTQALNVQLAGRRMHDTPSMHTAFALTPAPVEATAALESNSDTLAARWDARQGALHAEAAAGDRCSDGGDVWLLSEPELPREMLLALEVRCHRVGLYALLLVACIAQEVLPPP